MKSFCGARGIRRQEANGSAGVGDSGTRRRFTMPQSAGECAPLFICGLLQAQTHARVEALSDAPRLRGAL